MYLKLALRNAKRAILDYLLYIFSMVALIAVTCVANCIANWGEVQAGFQTMSLPLLIVVIMVILADYINMFIVKQRAKEFATYMLLGMEKNKLAQTFLCELSVIGMICFGLGVMFGIGICTVCFYNLLHEAGNKSMSEIIGKSILQTFVYFCFVEILSLLFMRRKVYKLQIIQLMVEKRRNQPLGAGKKSFWGVLFLSGFLSFFALLLGISFMPEKIMATAISVIAVPMLLSIFFFYKWLYAFFTSMRLSQADALYHGNRLYRMAEMTTGSGTSANMNTVFCICLIFSAASFVCGVFLFTLDVLLFEQVRQQWMGFLQIGISVVFLIIYFSILSFMQIIDLKRETGNIRLLFHMGKNKTELRLLFCTQVLVKMILPTLMSFIVLWAATPLVNYKVNTILSVSMHHLVLNAVCGFMSCFFGLYLCYFCVIYIIYMRHIKVSAKR